MTDLQKGEVLIVREGGEDIMVRYLGPLEDANGIRRFMGERVTESQTVIRRAYYADNISQAGGLYGQRSASTEGNSSRINQEN